MGPVFDRGREGTGASQQLLVTQTPPHRDPGPSGPNAAARVGPGAITSPRAWLVLLAVVIVGLATDLGSKAVAFRNIADGPVQISRERVLEERAAGRNLNRLIPHHNPVTVIPNVLEFSLVLNPGAVFGMGAGMRWFFVIFTVGALSLALWMFANWTRPRDRAAHIAIGLLIAGGLGNLYDRIVYACVRDFIHPLPNVRWPFGSRREIWPYVSNAADLFLLIGIGILMWFLWRTGPKSPPCPPVAQESPPSAPTA